MSTKSTIANKLTAGMLLTVPLAGCTLKLDFEGTKARTKVVSYQGEAGLTGTGIGIALAVGDIDQNNTVGGVTDLNDIVVAQELEFGTVAPIPVLDRPSDEDDPRSHFATNQGRDLSGNETDKNSRRYGISMEVKSLGGVGPDLELPELIVGSPSKAAGTAGNVVVFEGAVSFTFGVIVGRLAGDSQEPNFGQSVALGDLDGAIVGGNADVLQTLAVGAPGDGANAGAVYLFRTFDNAQGDVGFCTDGIPAALKIDAAAVAAALPASTAIGASFGTHIAVGELGNLLGVSDDRAELVVTEPGANRMFVFSFQPSAQECDAMLIDPTNVLEIPLGGSPTSLALLDANTANGKIAVGLAANQSGAGEVLVCTTDALVLPPTPSCTAIVNPVPTYERLGDFALGGFGTSMVSGDMNSDGFDDLLVGAPASRVGGLANAGAALMLFSDNTGGFITVADQVQVLADLIPEEGALTGTSVAILGDISGDAISEVAVGAPGANAGKGQALFYLDVTAPGFTPP